MQILLPPSETKRLGGRLPFLQAELAHDPQLGAVRRTVADALAAVSGDETAATKALKLGKKNRDERLLNLVLADADAMAAIDRYTGVLYDALGAPELSDMARGWALEHVHVQSALFGLIRAGDAIPGYRLSASSRLPGLAGALAKHWAPAHEGLLAGAPYVLDLRSKDYAALAPLATLGAAAVDYLEVVARGEDGEVRALNHFNKAAKGDLVARLAASAPAISSRADLIDWAEREGLDIAPAGSGDASGTLRIVTEQGVPAASR